MNTICVIFSTILIMELEIDWSVLKPHDIFAGVCDGIEYEILNDHTRNVKYDEVDSPYDFVCDDIASNSIISSDWKGPGWYRMSDPAGSQMSGEPVPWYHCGTQFGGRAVKRVTRAASLYRVSKNGKILST